MANLNVRPDAGRGGKRGHSNMDHWEFNDEIKPAAKIRRRQQAKTQVAEGLEEYSTEPGHEPTDTDELSE